jgi:hypothetical protein
VYVVCVCLFRLYLPLFVGGLMSCVRCLCLFVSSLPPVVCRRAHVLFTLFVFVCFVFTSSCLYVAHVLFTLFPSYKQREVKTKQTNTNNVNKT